MDVIAAFAVHGALLVGERVALTDIEDRAAKLRSFTITLARDGQQQASAGGANVLDSPLLAFAHLAEVLAGQSRFGPVQAGELVSTGTLSERLPAAAGERWETTLEGIELPGIAIELG